MARRFAAAAAALGVFGAGWGVARQIEDRRAIRAAAIRYLWVKVEREWGGPDPELVRGITSGKIPISLSFVSHSEARVRVEVPEGYYGTVYVMEVRKYDTGWKVDSFQVQ
jgi:hypothetical protein